MCKVSVIIPIYNSEQNLNKCLSSIRNQTHENLEIILFNNGSTDNSQQIAQGYARFDKRVRLFNINNLETYEIINYVTDNCTGKYVLYVDSKNSWLDKNAVKFMLDKVEEFNCDVIQVNDTRDNNECTKELILDNKSLMEALSREPSLKNNIWGKLYKTDLIKEMLVTNNMQVEESQWMNKLMSQVEKYFIINKTIIYQSKEN